MAVSPENEIKPSIQKSAEDHLSDKNGNHMYAIHLVEKYGLYADLDLNDILETLALL